MEDCPHPPRRLYVWVAYDGEIVVACCACGEVLQGAAEEHELAGFEAKPLEDR